VGATHRVRQPIHADRVGVPVRAENLKRADHLVVQLASVRVVCVNEDPITDLEGLVDWPDGLIDISPVPSLGRGEGGSDLRNEVPQLASLLFPRLAGRPWDCLRVRVLGEALEGQRPYSLWYNELKWGYPGALLWQ